MASGGVQRKTPEETRVYTASEARQRFADLFDEAVSSGRVMVTRRKKTVAIVDAAWLEEVERRLAEVEANDAETARREMEESGGKDLDQFEKENGLT